MDPALFFGGLAVLISLPPLAIGYYSYPFYRRVEGTARFEETTPIERDTVAVRGTITDKSTPVSSPLAESDAALIGWRVDEWDENYGKNQWAMIATGLVTETVELDVDGRPMTVALPTVTENLNPYSLGGTRRRFRHLQTRDDSWIRADEIAVKFDGEPETNYEVPPDAEPPTAVERFERTHQNTLKDRTTDPFNAVDVGNENHERRYRVATLDVGDEICVHGQYTSGDRETKPTIEPTDDGWFVLASGGDRQVARGLRWRALVPIGVGVMLAFGGVCGLLIGLFG